MSTVNKQIHDQKNGLTYAMHGDYYLPDLNLSDADKTQIGRYGRMRMKYLQKSHPRLYTRLILSGKLYDHLAEIDETSRERLDRMIPQMAQAEGVNELLKAREPMAWVGQMNALKHQAEEIILNELIYG